MQTCSSELWKIASRGGEGVKTNHLRTVQTRNVVVSNVMMSNAPKMTCPGDPRAQTHTQIVRAYLRCVCAGKQASAYTQPSRDRGRVRTF